MPLEASNQALSGTPHHWYFLKSIAGTNGRRTAVQIGGVVQYNLEVYCGVSLYSELRSRQGTALQKGSILRYRVPEQHALNYRAWGVPA